MELFDRVLRYLKSRYRPKGGPTWTKTDLHFFAKGAGLVSASFTSERAERPRDYFNKPEYRSGYLLYFIAANLPKVTKCLELMRPAERFAGQATVRMLDLGCGPGTAALAAAQYWQQVLPEQRIEITGIDQNRNILKDARGLFAAGNYKRARFQTEEASLGTKAFVRLLERTRYDIIICANTLNEILDIKQRERIVNNLLRHHLSKHGVLIIIEPALQRITRELMELRDRLLRGSWIVNRGSLTTETRDDQQRATSDERRLEATVQVLAPCLHQDRCPMLAHNKRDWCHAYLDWQRPKVIADVDKLIGNKKDYLKFSYMILANKTNHESRGTSHDVKSRGDHVALRESRFRVVSSPLYSKGKTELLLCPETGADTSKLRRLTRQNKDRSEANADFDQVVRGDLISCPATARLGPKDGFTIIAPFGRL